MVQLFDPDAISLLTHEDGHVEVLAPRKDEANRANFEAMGKFLQLNLKRARENFEAHLNLVRGA